jgi:hypothetical protein
MILGMIQNDLLNDAVEALEPMLAFVVRDGDFYEWYAKDNSCQGSAQYRGAAGQLALAILELYSKLNVVLKK